MRSVATATGFVTHLHQPNSTGRMESWHILAHHTANPSDNDPLFVRSIALLQ